jgi:hypothetical protein
VTFLAFGNGAPDIFSAIAAIGNAKNGEAGLAFGALLGKYSDRYPNHGKINDHVYNELRGFLELLVCPYSVLCTVIMKVK